ncbi:ferritin-like domain-containing protein [Patulibacter sp. SYSU D01012]|uniref:ferritin-like domain-containing protein n=1 Tax=Patulibacter sp. SYSU D01012 TaxID=2817381 RepID=UPI001B30BD59|nr:ferritin-like domain-containing protein [Patulibacter sp. SYSU D01012]
MTVTHHAKAGILSDQNAAKREEIVQLLTQAYWMEIETVTNYLAQSSNLDGIRAADIAADLAADVDEELGHAKQFAARIKELYGTVPGSADFPSDTDTGLQPNGDATDVASVIRGVIDAESGAIEHYSRIIEVTDGVDWATQDMVIAILRDEEGHMRTYERYLREFA